MGIGNVFDKVIGTGFKFDLVEQNELRVHFVSDVPYTKQEFRIELTVFIACHVDGVEQVNFILERNNSVGNIKQRLEGHRVNRRNERQRDICSVRYVKVQRDVGDVGINKDGLVVIVPSVAVNVSTVVVVTRRDRAIGEVALFISVNHHGKLFSEGYINKFNGLVWHCIAVHVVEGVFEDRTRHGHSKVIRWFNANLNRVRQQDFFAVGQLGNHVVRSG